jgi:hypothetical protein
VKKDKVLEQLESIKENAKENMEDSCFGEIWANDIIALDYAIKKVKKDKAYMSCYWQGAWHMFLLIFLIKVLEVILNLF